MTLPGVPGNKLVCVGNYRLTGKRLGKGNFAKVEEAVHTLLNVKVAIKIMNISEIKEDYVIQNLHREAKLMSKLSHPCITALFETMQNGNMYYLVTELVGGGDLCTFIKSQRNGSLDERPTRVFGRQLVSAVAHMHQLGIVHRDLKMENIMLNGSKTQLKIVDFGLSNQWSADRPLRTHCGSPEYAAPELFLAGKRYGPKVDLWSLGVILYGMVLGQLPFLSCRDDNITSQERRKRLLAQINRGLAPTHRKALAGLSTDFKNMIARLLAPDPDKRLSINDLVFHPWITESGHTYLDLNPLSKPSIAANADIIKDISQLVRSEQTSVSRTIQTVPFGNLSGMYNIIKHKKYNSLVDAECILKRNHHKTFSAKESRSSPLHYQASVLHPACTPRIVTIPKAPVQKLQPPKDTTVKSNISCSKKSSNTSPFVAAASVTTTKTIRRPSTTTTKTQQVTPTKNTAIRRPLSVQKVPSRSSKEAKLEAGDVTTTRMKSAQKHGYNLRPTVSRISSSVAGTPSTGEQKSIKNDNIVQKTSLEKSVKSEPLSNRKIAATNSANLIVKPAKRRSALPVVSTTSSTGRHTTSATIQTSKLQVRIEPMRNKSAGHYFQVYPIKPNNAVAEKDANQQIHHRCCKHFAEAPLMKFNAEYKKKFNNEPFSRSIVGYMNTIPSKIATFRWIKDLAKEVMEQ